MKLNKRTPRETTRTNETQRTGFRRFAPFVAGLAFTALSLLPICAAAQTHTCSVKRVNRPMESFQTHKMNRGKVTGLKMFIPGGKGKRIEILVPDTYVNHLASTAKAAPEKTRSTMIRSALKTTIEGGVAALGTKKTATFPCGQAPTAPAKTEPASTAKATPGKTVPAKKAAPALREPLAPSKKGGNGSQSTPYVIEIPVPRGTKKGTKLATSSLHVRPMRDGKAGDRIYFRLKFVTDPQSDKAYRSDATKLAAKVASVMAVTATSHLRARDKTAEPVSSGGLTGDALREIKGVAQRKTDTVGSYLGISKTPTKRRRTLGGI